VNSWGAKTHATTSNIILKKDPCCFSSYNHNSKSASERLNFPQCSSKIVCCALKIWNWFWIAADSSSTSKSGVYLGFGWGTEVASARKTGGSHLSPSPNLPLTWGRPVRVLWPVGGEDSALRARSSRCRRGRDDTEWRPWRGRRRPSPAAAIADSPSPRWFCR